MPNGMPVEEVPLLGFAAWSGTGKTSLLEKLIPLLRERGIRVGLIKQTHHDFDVDTPGKDSYRLRKAGAAQVMVASRHRWALMSEHDDSREEPRLDELLRHLDRAALDLVLVEGFKHAPIPKIELVRTERERPLLFPDDPCIIAVASNGPLPVDDHPPRLDLDDGAGLADFVEAWLQRN